MSPYLYAAQSVFILDMRSLILIYNLLIASHSHFYLRGSCIKCHIVSLEKMYFINPKTFSGVYHSARSFKFSSSLLFIFFGNFRLPTNKPACYAIQNCDLCRRRLRSKPIDRIDRDPTSRVLISMDIRGPA